MSKTKFVSEVTVKIPEWGEVRFVGVTIEPGDPSVGIFGETFGWEKAEKADPQSNGRDISNLFDDRDEWEIQRVMSDWWIGETQEILPEGAD